MARTLVVLQSSYLPWKGYFDLINLADEFVIYDEVQYTKNDWRNRNRIKTQHGVEWLTVPVLHESLSQRILDTEVADPHWARKHWNAIRTNYGGAPFFRQYSQPFAAFYAGNRESRLSPINAALIRLVNGILGITTKISASQDHAVSGDATGRLLELCERTGATRYLTGPAARGYLEVQRFAERGIAVEWMDYSGYPEYPQLHPPFEHAVSVIDLIFNTGPEAPRYMKSFSPGP